MVCKCSNNPGYDIAKADVKAPKAAVRYFDRFQRLQFEKEADEYPDMNYPQVVDAIKKKGILA